MRLKNFYSVSVDKKARISNTDTGNFLGTEDDEVSMNYDDLGSWNINFKCHPPLNQQAYLKAIYSASFIWCILSRHVMAL